MICSQTVLIVFSSSHWLTGKFIPHHQLRVISWWFYWSPIDSVFKIMFHLHSCLYFMIRIINWPLERWPPYYITATHWRESHERSEIEWLLWCIHDLENRLLCHHYCTLPHNFILLHSSHRLFEFSTKDVSVKTSWSFPFIFFRNFFPFFNNLFLFRLIV